MLSKKDLVKKAAEAAGQPQTVCTEVLDALIKSVTDALAEGESIQLTGFGTFEIRERPERDGRNPKTGEAIKIAACKAPAFKAGKTLKDAVNK